MHKSFRLWVGLASVVSAISLSGLANAGAGPQDAAAPSSVAADLVPNGTHLLVRLDDELNTRNNRLNKKFEVKTLEPLETAKGGVLPPGMKIRGHISRIEPAGLTGRARLWLTFDDIGTNRGRLPIVAEVSSVPGDFGVKPGESKEGEIEARTSQGARDFEAAAAGAAIGEAAGGIAGFVASSGFGQELDLPKGTKLDLVLDRPLYLTR